MQAAFSLDNKYYNVYGTTRNAGRDIVAVILPNGTRQPFYRSTGQNSKMPGKWLPFDGIAKQGAWFHKSRFCAWPVPNRLHRLGTDELAEVSIALGNIPILEATEASWQDCNAWLRAHGCQVKED